jgi:hypothetical protein
MSAGLPEQNFSKDPIQPVRLAIQIVRNKPAPFSLALLPQVKPDVTTLALKLVDYTGQGMPFITPAQGHFLRPVGSDQ